MVWMSVWKLFVTPGKPDIIAAGSISDTTKQHTKVTQNAKRDLCEGLGTC